MGRSRWKWWFLLRMDWSGSAFLARLTSLALRFLQVNVSHLFILHSSGQGSLFPRLFFLLKLAIEVDQLFFVNSNHVWHEVPLDSPVFLFVFLKTFFYFDLWELLEQVLSHFVVLTQRVNRSVVSLAELRLYLTRVLRCSCLWNGWLDV